MKIYLNVELEPGEDSICCECDEELPVDPAHLFVILAKCPVCDCPVGYRITQFDIVRGGKQ